MRMKITKKRFKEILAEEMQNLQNEKADYDKIGRSTDAAAGKISKNRKGQKLHPAGKPMEEGSNDDDGAIKHAHARMKAFDDHFGDDFVKDFDDDHPWNDDEDVHPDADHIAAGKIADKIYDLANEIDEYGQYDTETQTEAYRQLLQAMKASGVNLERMLMILHESSAERTNRIIREEVEEALGELRKMQSHRTIK